LKGKEEEGKKKERDFVLIDWGVQIKNKNLGPKGFKKSDLFSFT
jgi:hypothetical protein